MSATFNLSLLLH